MIRLVVVELVLIGGVAIADTVTLTSGRVIEDVKVEQQGSKVKVTKADGSTATYPSDMVKSIEKKPTAKEVAEAAAKEAKAREAAEAAAKEAAAKEKAAAEAREAAATAQELANRRKALGANDVDARLHLAAWCEEKKLAVEAKSLYEEALALDASCAVAHKALGHVEYKGRWYADCKALVDGELERAKDDLVALRALVQLCLDRKYGVPPALFRRILTIAPDDVDAHRGLGHVQVDGKWVDVPLLESDFHVYYSAKALEGSPDMSRPKDPANNSLALVWSEAPEDIDRVLAALGKEGVAVVLIDEKGTEYPPYAVDKRMKYEPNGSSRVGNLALSFEIPREHGPLRLRVKASPLFELQLHKEQ